MWRPALINDMCRLRGRLRDTLGDQVNSSRLRQPSPSRSAQAGKVLFASFRRDNLDGGERDGWKLLLGRRVTV